MNVRLAVGTYAKLQQLAFEEARKSGQVVSFGSILNKLIVDEHKVLQKHRQAVVKGKKMPWEGRKISIETNGAARHAMQMRFEPEVRAQLEDLADDAAARSGGFVSCTALLGYLIERRHARLGKRKKQLEAMWAPAKGRRKAS